MKAERCPVCRGSGYYIEYEILSNVTKIKDKCHGCKDREGVSRGWILVPETNPPLTEYPLVYPPLRPTPRPYPRPIVRDIPIEPFPFNPFKPKRRIPHIGDPQPLRKKRWYIGDPPMWRSGDPIQSQPTLFDRQHRYCKTFASEQL